MSEEAAGACLERMKSDKMFRDRVMAIEDVEERMAFVSSEGYDCTAEELRLGATRLGDEELDAVAAGYEFEEGCGQADWCWL